MARREFQLTDAKSNKFWAISAEGSSTTVEWGRIGTKGQSKSKDFASEAEAQASHDALVREKLRTGYVEVGATTTTATKSATKKVRGPAKSTSTATTSAKKTTSTSTATTAPKPGAAASAALPPIDLPPAVWRRATWRKLGQLPRTTPAPFDLAACVARAGRARKPDIYTWDWSPCGLSPSMTPEEAHFWIVAITTASKLPPAEHARALPTTTRPSRTTARTEGRSSRPTCSRWRCSSCAP